MVDEDVLASGAAGAPGADWALSRATQDTAENYLKEQTRLARLQADELLREDGLRRWSHRVRHISDVMKVTFELSAALVALVLVVILGATIWSAAHDSGAIIEAFKVPPNMAGNGLSGDVVASQLLDRLADLQVHTATARAAGSYASNFGSDLRIAIPDTGVSIGEAYRYLAGWLGHQTHISGEIFRTGNGLALAVRAGNRPGGRFIGTEQNLDRLVQRAAEYIYGQTQPFRYGVYLMQQNRLAEAGAVLGDLAVNGPESERSWAYADWMNLAMGAGDLANGLKRAEEAARIDPQNELSQINAATAEGMAAHDGQIRSYAAATRATYGGGGRREVAGLAASVMAHIADAAVAEEQGDFETALAAYGLLLAEPEFNGSHWASDYMKAADAARMHDLVSSRRYLGEGSDTLLLRLAMKGTGWNLINLEFPQYQ